MGGGDQVNMPEAVRAVRGSTRQMGVGGTLFELESIRAFPRKPRVGWWTMEWWWDQPDNPHVKAFVADIKKATGKNPTRGIGSVMFRCRHSRCLATSGKDRRRLKPPRDAGFKLPPEIAMQPERRRNIARRPTSS